MKKGLIVAVALVLTSACASGVKKSFTITTDPPDATIRVVSGGDLSEKKYTSPAHVTAQVPKDSALLAKNIVEVSRDAYKSKKIALRDIRDGEALKIKLDKTVRYKLSCRLLGPARSDSLRFEDKIISLFFTVSDQGFLMNLANLTPYELKILWNQAEYTDVFNRPRRLMHSGVRYEDRNNSIPPQTVPARGAFQQMVMPVASVVYSQEKKGYEVQPLFPLDSEAAPELKGKVFYLFIPVEYERQIIPYNFKVEITDVVKG